MKFKSTINLLMAFLIFSFTAHSQGRVDGFFPSKGQLSIVPGAGVELTSEYYAGENLVSLNRDIFVSSLFVSYGIIDGIEVSAAAPYIQINDEQNLQDGSLYAKFRLATTTVKGKELSFALAAGYSTNLTDYETEGINAIGQQATFYDIRPIVHLKLNKGWFATGQFAYLSKSDPTPSAVNAVLKVGQAKAKYYYDFWYDFQNSDGGANYRGTPAPNTFKELGVDYHKAGGTFFYNISGKIGAFLGVFYTLDGRNVNKGIGINGGIVFKNK